MTVFDKKSKLRYGTTKSKGAIMVEENTKAKVYEVRNKGEYGTFVLMYQENYLEIICHTSFGTYGHTWNSPGQSAFDFMINMPYETFVYKISQGHQYVLDNEKQEEKMVQLIHDLAPLKQWSEDEVEFYKQLVEEVVYCGKVTEEEFKSQLVHSELFEELYDSDYEQIETEEKIDEQLVGLYNLLWLVLIEKIKAEKMHEINN